MPKKNRELPTAPVSRRLLRWGLRIVAVLVALFALQIGLLAFPQLLLRNQARAGSVIVNYPGAPDPAIQALAEATDQRLRSGGFGNPQAPERIFFFPDRRLYSLFTLLARQPSEAQGFGISALGTTYVSGPQVEALGERTGHSPRYSVWEGEIPHTMAHEIAHLIMVDSIGRSTWKSLPQWKREGYPEYISNIGLIREDSAASLPSRIGVLLDDSQWLGPRSWDRIHYEAGVMVEFLLEVRGMDLQGILAQDVTREDTYAAMVEWSGMVAVTAYPPARRATSTEQVVALKHE